MKPRTVAAAEGDCLRAQWPGSSCRRQRRDGPWHRRAGPGRARAQAAVTGDQTQSIGRAGGLARARKPVAGRCGPGARRGRGEICPARAVACSQCSGLSQRVHRVPAACRAELGTSARLHPRGALRPRRCAWAEARWCRVASAGRRSAAEVSGGAWRCQPSALALAGALVALAAIAGGGSARNRGVGWEGGGARARGAALGAGHKKLRSKKKKFSWISYRDHSNQCSLEYTCNAYM